ncbi:unnamed protein product [Cunninghamella blakesleeana]
MGVQNYITISDPELAHELLVSKGVVTSDRSNNAYLQQYTYNGRGIIFSNADKKWKRIRTAALELLAPQKVDDFVDLIVDEVDLLIEELLNKTKQHGEIYPLKYLQASTLNVILLTTFGTRVESINDPLLKEITHNFETHMKLGSFTYDYSSYLPFLKFLDIIIRKRHIIKTFIDNSYHPLFKGLADQASKNKKDCFYTRLLKMKEEYGLIDEDILVAVSDLTLGGGDTASVTITWAVAILSNRPDIQKKIIKELDDYIHQHNKLPTHHDRSQFPYLLTVVKEVLRFRPVTSLGLPHLNNEDVILRNYFIPKGSVIATSMEAIHFNSDFYDDPETFNPDRFAKNNKSLMSCANGNILDRDQFNFGWGRRICPGIHLAEVEMFYILTRLFAKCTVELPLDENGKEIPVDIDSAVDGLVVHPLPFNVRFVPRDE